MRPCHTLCCLTTIVCLAVASVRDSRADGLFDSTLDRIISTGESNDDQLSTASSDIELASCQQDCQDATLCSCSLAALGLGGGDRLLGIIAPSDRAFRDFVSPITNPLFFEDPRTLSEIRPIFAHHWIPNNNPVLLGGQAQYFAVQARVALTERLSFIATKDGYIWLDANNPAVIPDNSGWADVAVGLKYNLIRDPSLPLLVSVGGTYSIPCGSGRVLQGNGDGEFHLFGTAGVGLTQRSHWLSATGFRLPSNSTDGSQMWYWSNHFDYEILDTLYGLVELNWFHWMKSGDRLPVNFEGGDLFNLGSTGVAGNDIVTLGIGGKKRFGDMNEFGVAYEVPLTERKDILQSRLYVDLIIRY